MKDPISKNINFSITKTAHIIKQRIDIKELEPEAYKVMSAMENYLSTTNLATNLREFIKIRVSQINGCAYCIQIHTKDARKVGETEQRIYSLSTWRESPLYTEEERAVLALADEVTKISDYGITEKTFENLKGYYTENQIAQMIIAINQINSWNRIAIATKMFHESE